MQHDEAGELTRILVLTTTLPTEEGDATPSFVLDLAQEMAEQMPASITIVAPAAPGAPLRQQFGSVEVRRFRHLPQRWASLGASTAIVPAIREKPIRVLQVPLLLAGLALVSWRLSRRIRPDVIHSHWIVPVAILGEVVRRLTPGRPAHVVTSHGSDVHALKGPLWMKARGWVTDAADLVIPVSQEIADELGLEHVPVVPMGASPLFSNVSRQPEAGRLLFVGRLVESKGLDTALRAAALVPDVHLRIVGDGPDMRKMKDLAATLGVSERCEFLGALPKKAVADELSRAAALVMPSRPGSDGTKEGFPSVLMEAVVAGVPVIASRIGGVPTILTHFENALLFAPGDYKQLAELISNSTDDPAAGEIRARAALERLGNSAASSGAAAAYAREVTSLARRGEPAKENA